MTRFPGKTKLFSITFGVKSDLDTKPNQHSLIKNFIGFICHERLCSLFCLSNNMWLVIYKNQALLSKRNQNCSRKKESYRKICTT